MNQPRALFEKVWNAHEVAQRQDGASLLWIDRHLVHEGSHHAFGELARRDAEVARPDLTFGVADHYVPTRRDPDGLKPNIRKMLDSLERNTRGHGIDLFGLSDPRQGIVHVVGPEQGLTLPGLTIVCGDSHTSTHGAFGSIAFGIGASDVAHVLITQTLWQRQPKSMLVTIDGQLGTGITAKDVALSTIAHLGSDGAIGHAIEYAGGTVRGLSMEGRLTLCNLSIESGARFGMVAPDQVTFDYVAGRPFAPSGPDFERAVTDWMALSSDPDASFDRIVEIDARAIAPTVTWGISPDDALPIDAAVPYPERTTNMAKADHWREAIEYMGLQPGQKLTDIRIDRVFIGSCTNGRIEDLRAAAAVLAGRKCRVPGHVSPGSAQIKAQAEQEGIARVFIEAGLEWVEPGCSMCVGMNGDIVPPGERCASTTNRNFKGRQGPRSRTHLMSPAMVAAAAVTGHITDARLFLEGFTP